MYDSHVDTPSQLIRLRNIGIDNPHAHVDFPKLRKGGVDGSFFALYTPASLAPDTATRYALEMLSAVYDAVDANPDYAALAFSPQEAVRNKADGLISIFMGMENGAPIQESLPLLRTFYRLGVSYMTLTHNGDNALADSAAEGRKWGGLSPFGKQVVAEMNALGMMIDLSHASDKTFWDCIKLSQAPVVATHSCCRALCGHRRNLILDEADAVEARFIENPADRERADAWHRMQDRLLEMPRPGVKEVVDHIDHAVRLAGIDHVGIGTDFDGISVPPMGLEDVSKLPVLWDEMRRRGYAETDIEKVSGGNLMAVWRKIVKYSELAD